MITQKYLQELRELGLADSDIIKELKEYGHNLAPSTVWRQRNSPTNSFIFNDLEKLLQKHKRKHKKLFGEKR
jgi:hypothetical protein